MSDRLHIDIESFSEADLKKVGMYAYAEHLSTEVLVLCFALSDGPVHVWVPYDRFDIPQAVVDGTMKQMAKLAEKYGERLGTLYVQTECSDLLKRAVLSGMELSSHNAGFERTILNGPPGQRIGFPHTEIEQWVCTAAKCRAHGLPGALGNAAEALGTCPKDEDGKGDMMQVTKPRRGKEPRWTPSNAPDKFIKLYSYCTDDVRAERDIDWTVPDLSPFERDVWLLDQKINDRGVLVDLKAIAAVQDLIGQHKAELEEKCVEWTGFKPTQRDKLAEWIRTNGWPHLRDLQAETVSALVMHPSVPDSIKRVLRLYSTFGAKAVTKYDAMKEAACADGRLRGLFIYHGASTGRWSSILVQLQNLFRPVIKDPSVAIDALATRSLSWVRELYE